MKIAAAILTASAVLIMPLSASALESEQAVGYERGIISYEKSVNGIKENESLLSGTIAEYAGTDSSDWLMIGVIRCGLETDTAEYYQHWKNYIDDNYPKEKSISHMKATEWHRAVLTGICLGADPTSVSGIDLLAGGTYGRGQNDPIGEQGLNGWIWALIALDSCDWKIPDGADISRLEIINEIISMQNFDGGFAVVQTDGVSDPDMTAMTLQALSPYRECKETHRVIQNSLSYLVKKQESFDTCETVAQTICALCCLGIDPDEDPRFSELTDELISYSNSDGGFAHTKGGESNEMASSQALIALCSLNRLRSGERSVYDLNAGMPEEVKETSLLNAAAEKNKNTAPPHIVQPADEMGRSGYKLLTGITLAISVAAITLSLVLRRRKDKSK